MNIENNALPDEQPKTVIDLYDILGVDKNAETPEIRKRYLKLLKQYHPDKDKSGDGNKFIQIRYAFKVLGNNTKRTMYDLYSYEGLEEEPPFSLFSGYKRAHHYYIPKVQPAHVAKEVYDPKMSEGKDIQVNLSVTFKHLYNGSTKQIRIKRRVTCRDCVRDRKSLSHCEACRGHGSNRGKGFAGREKFQTWKNCDVCNGTGKRSGPVCCETCNGNRTIIEKKLLEVKIEQGMMHGQNIILVGEGFNSPCTYPGNVIFTLILRKHHDFSLRYHDLYVKKKVHLVEVFTGADIHIKHLDGRVLEVPMPELSKIKANSTFKIE
eukprot:UN31158